MKLRRQELINYEEQWLNDHPMINDNPQEYNSFLDGLNNILLSHEYEEDERFVTYGRRDFLRQEFSDYLNDKKQGGRGKYNDAFVDLAEYYGGNTFVGMSLIPEGEDRVALENNNKKYLDEGIVCKQEAEIILEMIKEFKEKL